MEYGIYPYGRLDRENDSERKDIRLSFIASLN